MQVTGKRRFNRIEYSNEIRQLNINKKKGTQQETASLNINLKNINKNYLIAFMEQNKQEGEQHKIIFSIISDYINKSKGNFQSTRKLFGAEADSQEQHHHIRKFMAEIYEDTEFVRRILSNQKMDFKTKLVFIKFLQKIRLSAFTPKKHKIWKQRL